MGIFTNPLENWLAHGSTLREVAPGVWVTVRRKSSLTALKAPAVLHGVGDRIRTAWTTLRGASKTVDLKDYLDRVESRAA